MRGAPSIRGSATSEEAAGRIAPKAPTYRERVFDFIKRYGPVSDEQIAENLRLDPSTARPRRVELVQEGRVCAYLGFGTTKSGARCNLWIVAPDNGQQTLFGVAS